MKKSANLQNLIDKNKKLSSELNYFHFETEMIVKHKIRNFIGKITKILPNNKALIEPINNNIKNLYPFGIEALFIDLELQN